MSTRENIRLIARAPLRDRLESMVSLAHENLQNTCMSKKYKHYYNR